MYSMFLLFGLIVAVIVAAFFILQNRKMSNTLKNTKKEPVLNIKSTAENFSEEYLDEAEFLDDNIEEDLIDPVEESFTEEKVVRSSSNIPSPFPNDLIVLLLRAKPDRPYAGYELLQALLSAGLRYGKMNIFHRYEQINSKGEVLFSVASVTEPGTFEIPKMGGFTTPGLTIFMQVSIQKDPATAFELMLDTARQLLDDLEGEIWDDQKQPLSEEKINQYRKIIAEYERSRSTEDMFPA